MNNYNNKINILQYEKGRMLQNPTYHTLDDAILINNISPTKAKSIWEEIGGVIKLNIKGIDSSVCPFCLFNYCGVCEYSGRNTICQTSQDDFLFIKKLSNTWYKETYKTINNSFK